MKRKIMLTVILFFSMGLYACNNAEDAPLECDEGYEIVDEACKLIENNELVCESPQILNDTLDACVDATIECADDEILIDGTCETDPNEGYEVFLHDGIERRYLIHVPTNVESGAPLLFSLHGFTGSPLGNQYVTHFNDIADREGFVVVYPYGTLVEGVSHWNAKLEYSDADDLGFLVALAGYLQTEYDLEIEHTFITGFSNGGFMSYEVACQASDTFKAAAPVSGLMSQGTFDACLGNPIPILHIHGAMDRVVPIDGEMEVGGGWAGPSVDEIIEYWNTVNGNSLVEDYSIGTTNIDKYFNNTNENDVWYYNVTDYDHIWPGSIDYYSPVDAETAGFDASEVIWEFFSQFLD